MNRLLYRVVFNKARGMLMVVADIARACSGGSVSSGIGHNHRRLVCRVSAMSFSLWLALGAVQPVQASIVADKSAPGSQQPTVIVSANGTPQVNIQTPSAGGVSRNTYSQFDVDQKGVILNNSRKNTSTQLGGMVSANPWMAKGEAKIILNEVNARDPSRLNGYIEVAGQKAQVVIASPSGITCNGCGFINAGRTTLTTGTAQMQNGNLTGYQVERGEIVVEGKGLDASRQDYTDIIARAVKVNAAIYASDLKVTAGRNQVDAAHEKTTAQADDGTVKPQLAVDVSQVGGMYAGKIRLRATERGVGVRNAGTLGSEAGLVTVTADGRIENSGELSSQQSLQLSSASGVSNSGKMLSQQGLAVNTAGDISNGGTVWSSADATLAASGAVQNSGSVAAGKNVTLSGSSLASSGKSTLAAGVQHDGRTGSSGDLTLSAAGKLEINGLNLAGGNVRAAGQGIDASGSQTQAKNITLDAKQGDLSAASAQVIATGTLSATTAGTLNNVAGQIAADKLSLSARRLNNQQGQLIQSGTQSLTLNHQDGINNQGGKIATNAADLTLQTASLDNRDGEITHAGSGTLTVAAAALQGNNGSMASSGTLALSSESLVLDGTSTTANRIRIDAGNLSNRAGKLVQSGSGEMTLNVRENTDNQDGLIAANGAVSLNTKNLANGKGRLLAAQSGSLAVTASGQTDNSDGLLAAADSLTLTTGQLNNNGGQISAQQGAAKLTSSRQLTNVGGQIAAAKNVQLTADGLDSRQGQLSGDNVSLQLGKQALNNQSGRIAAKNTLTVSSGELNNDAGLMQSGGGISLDTHGQRLTNSNNMQTGGIYAQSSLALSSGSLDNTGGSLFAGGDATLTTGSLTSQNGRLLAGKSLNIDAQGALNNTAGLVQSGGDMRIDTHGQAVSNAANIQSGGLVSGGRLTLNAGSVDNAQGLMLADSDMSLTTGTLLSRDGALVSSGNMAISASGQVDNTAGLIQSAQRLAVDTHGSTLLNNNTLTSGGLYAGEALTLTGGRLENAAGAIASGGDIQLQSGALNNRAGELTAGGDLAVTTKGDLINDAGLMQSGAATKIDTLGHALSNRQTSQSGGIQAGGELRLNSASLDNAQGNVVTKSNATLTTGRLDNKDGQLAAGQQMTVAAGGAVNNDRGLIQSGGDMRLDAQQNSLSNRDTKANGGLISFGKLNVSAGEINNQSGMLAGAGETAVQATRVDNGSGVLASESNLRLNAQGVDNRDGTLSAGLEMALTLAEMLNNSAGKVSSGGDLNIDAGQLDNQQGGVVAAGGDAGLNIGQTDNRQGQLSAQGNFSLRAETLNNDGGLVQSGRALSLTAGQISNQHSGDTGGITSQGDMQITASALNNNSGVLLAGKQAALDAATFSNIAGTLVALDILKLSVQSDTDNRQGLLQGGGIVLDTNGHLLDNRDGTLNSLAAMQLTTAGLNNQRGTLGAKGDFTLRASWLDNGNSGRVVGESSATLTLAQLLNGGGQIQTVGNLLINAAQGVIDNSLGLIRSGATATLTAASLANRDTLKADKGIEGRDIVINSGELDNAAGSVLAGQNLSVTNGGALDNSGGELAAASWRRATRCRWAALP